MPVKHAAAHLQINSMLWQLLSGSAAKLLGEVRDLCIGEGETAGNDWADGKFTIGAERPLAPQVVEKFGAARLLEKPVQALSGGERQRIGLIRALAARPKLLLCDEPVGAIDRVGRFSLLDRLREHVEAKGIVMMMITHDPEEILSMAGHVWHIDSGRLLAEGPPQRFFGASVP